MELQQEAVTIAQEMNFEDVLDILSEHLAPSIEMQCLLKYMPFLNNMF
jgi:hypothetical protein